mgnify:CR=1 FL=1
MCVLLLGWGFFLLLLLFFLPMENGKNPALNEWWLWWWSSSSAFWMWKLWSTVFHRWKLIVKISDIIFTQIVISITMITSNTRSQFSFCFFFIIYPNHHHLWTWNNGTCASLGIFDFNLKNFSFRIQFVFVMQIFFHLNLVNAHKNRFQKAEIIFDFFI